ncbi:hypothetical protein Tco_1555612 [Tanacetum coccineum]
MKKTRKEYKESQGFRGPLLLMVLLYVHATISERVVVEDQTPLMKSWDTMKLKLRENKELDMGGFGRLRKLKIGIKNSLKFTESVKNKVDEMLEIASITYPDNEEFKRIAEYRNERIMKAFKPGKLEANLDGNVGGGGNENELEANLNGNVGGDEENLESNLVNSKKGKNCDVDMGKSMDEGKETNLDGVLKEGDIDISKRVNCLICLNVIPSSTHSILPSSAREELRSSSRSEVM